MRKIILWILGVLTVLSLVCIYCVWTLSDGLLHAYVLDIGQGDSILIRTPADENLLIDGGPDDSVLQQISHILPFYDRTIDVMILSHPHADHINGLVEVLKRYEVREVVITGVSYNYAGYSSFLQLIREKQIPIIFAGNQNDYRLGTLLLDMLYPMETLQGRSFENQNNSSIVFRLLYGERIFYFSGDLEMEKEAELVKSGLDLHADFYKVAHHGSRTSSTEQFLDLLKPKIAVISCGVNNKFHHPYPLTLEHFQQRKVQVFRTDLDGTVETTSDGKTLQVKAFGGN